jgi:hypothetical protein
VDWYIRYIGIPLTIATWFGLALLLLVVFWPAGVFALIGAALLTERLLARYASTKQAPVRRGFEAGKDLGK